MDGKATKPREYMDTAVSMSDMSRGMSLEVNQALLKEDDDLLRQIFSQVFKQHHPQLANKVDVIFTLAQVSCDRALGVLELLCAHRRGGPAAAAAAAAAVQNEPFATLRPTASPCTHDFLVLRRPGA